jgi:hypothetical protein
MTPIDAGKVVPWIYFQKGIAAKDLHGEMERGPQTRREQEHYDPHE